MLFLVGLTFASIALVINAIARGYDFFTYYFTLMLTPMIFVSGVYYPVSQLPVWLQPLAQVLPLGVAVQVVRPLLLGQLPEAALQNILILMSYCFFGFYLATVLTRRRLLK
jgi:lipooligosaccharide transport system permease protein